MFLAKLCSSSGGQILLIQHPVSSLVGRTCEPDGHLQSVSILDAVLIQFDLLMMSTICASIWTFTKVIIRYTVSKTSKPVTL